VPSVEIVILIPVATTRPSRATEKPKQRGERKARQEAEKQPIVTHAYIVLFI
jgi:hypothetical protein